MDVFELKKLIIENSNTYITTILEALELNKINNLPNEIRCCRSVDGSGTSIRIKKDTLYTTDFSSNLKGDIITLVQDVKKYTFKESISFICKCLDINENIVQKQISLPFGGYFSGLKIHNEYVEDKIQTYPEEILNEYWNVANKRFLKDGISIKTQLKYNIGYDLETDRISIPWRNIEGDIVGIIGRINCDNYKEFNTPKYYPLIPFSKSQVLYGLYENYNDIVGSGVVFVGEGEKTTLQMDSMGVKNCVSIGSHNISNTQINLIQSLFPKQIILIFDEDLEEKFLIEEGKKIKTDIAFLQTKVGYIYDRENKYLKKGSKVSPTDVGVDNFKMMLQECLYYIN